LVALLGIFEKIGHFLIQIIWSPWSECTFGAEDNIFLFSAEMHNLMSKRPLCFKKRIT